MRNQYWVLTPILSIVIVFSLACFQQNMDEAIVKRFPRNRSLASRFRPPLDATAGLMSSPEVVDHGQEQTTTTRS